MRTANFWVFTGLLVIAGTLAQVAVIGTPQLPQIVPSVVFPGEQATVLTPANGAALTTALTGVACGTTIRLTHGVTYSTATAFPLTSNCTCRSASNVYNNSQWVIIESDQYIGGSVRGNRIDPSTEYGKLAYISSTDTNYAFTATNNGAGCYWFLGLDVLQNAGNFQAVFSFGDGSSTNWAHDFVIDHSYVHFTPTANATRCVVINAKLEAIVDSYLSDCHKTGQDSQGIEGWDSLGGVLIQNNFIEGATENMMVGGNVPTVPGISPCDFTIQKNHFFKPLTWRQADPSYAGIHFSVKNMFENKNICRELITANVFQNNWEDSQNGVDLLFDVENICCGTSNPNPAAIISDVNLTFNLVQGGAGVGNLSTSNSNISPLNQPLHRFSAHDNLYTGIDENLWGHGGSIRPWNIGGRPPTSLFAPYDINFTHETIASANMSEGVELDGTPLVDVRYGLTFTNSIIDGGQFGVFFASGIGSGNAVITNFVPTANFTYLCGYGGNTNFGTLPNVANNQTPVNQAAIFVTPGTDWHVAPASFCYHMASDGLSMGANIDAVNSATAGVVQALANPVTVTNISPTTFTHLGGTGLTITGTNFLNESGLGVIVGGAGPTSTVNTVTCATNTCTVVMTQSISLQVNDTIVITLNGARQWVSADGNLTALTVASVTDGTHFTFTDNGIGTASSGGGTANRYTPGNACTSVMVTNSTTITCTTPAASGTVTTGPVSVFVSQWGIPVQSTVFGNYN